MSQLPEVTLSVKTPPALRGFIGTYETLPSGGVHCDCRASGVETERVNFRRHVETMAGILRSLQELDANVSITCRIVRGEFQASGSIVLWFDGAWIAVQQAMRKLYESGQCAARASVSSSADIHMQWGKEVTRTIAEETAA